MRTHDFASIQYRTTNKQIALSMLSAFIGVLLLAACTILIIGVFSLLS